LPVRPAAKSGMTEISTQDRAKRRSSAAHAAVLVSGYDLARHFGCSGQTVDLLAQQGVIERRSDGKFDQDVSRLKYLTHLRSEHRRSPRAAADAKHALAKAALVRIRIEKKQRELVRRDEVDALIDGIAGRHPDRIVESACAVRAAWRSCDPAQHRALSVRGADRDSQRLPADGRQGRRAAA
jgi:hypothetical protein